MAARSAGHSAASLLVLLASCASGIGDPPATDDEATDLDPVSWSGGKADAMSSTFQQNEVMSVHVLTASSAVTADAIQAFLASSPYGTRSWLADYTASNGESFAQLVMDSANAHGIDPVALLARAQVESSLVSATSQPSATRVNAALGCGCPDNGGCLASDDGLATQLDCAGLVLATQMANSAAGDGTWNRGRARATQDQVLVTPADDSTAALYAYTPWVLVGQGGNWLVWNVTRRFFQAFDNAGALNL
ncbi:MAG TPA: hypothetical protein VMJ10_10075 [Kofleriaceae bacterium]|nr:hypothetical protein [Kofleriaceae bacterium]